MKDKDHVPKRRRDFDKNFLDPNGRKMVPKGFRVYVRLAKYELIYSHG